MSYAYQTPRRVTVSSRQPGELPTGDLLREVRATERQRVINEVLDALEGVNHRRAGWDGVLRDRTPEEMIAAAKAAVKELQEVYR